MSADCSIYLTGYDLDELTTCLIRFLEENRLKPFRAKQIINWIYNQARTEFSEMDNLPRNLRTLLSETFSILSLECLKHLSAKDGAEKFLWMTNDGLSIESVYMPSIRKATLCLSTQVGCPLECAFCATGEVGYWRNLRADEIVTQALAMRSRRRGSAEVSNIVFMGMGEPLLNYDNLGRAIRILNNPALFQIGARRITVSTAGIPRGIKRLAKDFPQVKLAVSLNAPVDSLRDRLMPINRRYPLRMLMESVKHFTETTGKRVTFEYVIIPGVNDSPSLAYSLKKCIDGIPSKLNLIALNRPCPGAFRAPSAREVKKFQELLMRLLPQPVTLRNSMGEAIQAACGQLVGGRVRKKGTVTRAGRRYCGEEAQP